MLIVGHEAVDAILVDVDDVVDEGSSAGEVVNPFVRLLLQDLHVLLAVC